MSQLKQEIKEYLAAKKLWGETTLDDRQTYIPLMLYCNQTRKELTKKIEMNCKACRETYRLEEFLDEFDNVMRDCRDCRREKAEDLDEFYKSYLSRFK